MHVRFVVAVAAIVLAGCASINNSNRSDRNFNAIDLTVDLNSNSLHVLASVPPESEMEHFETIDQQGRMVSYVAFTDTDIGGLVFVDQKLYGMLSRHDAQAFYSCRGYATAAPKYWAYEASDWVASLLDNSKPAANIKLEFSGKSTTQSIKEVADNSMLKQMKSLLGMGTNPLGIFSSLSTARNELEAKNQYDKALKGLSLIRPGMTESRVAEIVNPEDVSFVTGGMVMAYPSHLVEYYITDGIVKVIQHPSFHYLSKSRATLFYAPNIKWSLCTPLRWKEAYPETTKTP